MQETLHTTGQAAVRVSLLMLGGLVLLASDSGFDPVLGAFSAGIVVGLALDSPGGEGQVVRSRLEGIGFGFVIPVYFVVTGMGFDIDSLLSPTGLALAALFLMLLVFARGASASFWARDLSRRETTGLALLGTTGLPLIVAITDIGVDRGALTPQLAASFVGAGMLSVLFLPLLAVALVGREAAPGTHSMPILVEELEEL